MDRSESPEHTYPCLDCFAGVRRLHYITYFTWLQDQLITTPNFPAWVCDVCGRREFDPRAVTWLNTLLNSPKKRTPPRPSHRPGPELPAI